MNQIDDIQTGNAADEHDHRGWFVGHFLDKAQFGLRHSNDVEIKWGAHPAGDDRDWVTGETRTAVCILISGKVELLFRGKTVLLSRPGDFVMWGKGADHSRRVLEDAITITVRWPSVPKDY